MQSLETVVQNIKEKNALILGIFTYMDVCKENITVTSKSGFEFAIVKESILTMINQGTFLSESIMDDLGKARKELEEMKNGRSKHVSSEQA